MNELEAFGFVIKNLRKKFGFSQEELSRKSGLDRTYISLIENGQRNPTLITIIKLSKSFGISNSDIIKEFEAVDFCFSGDIQ